MATTVIIGDIAEGQKWWGTAEFLKTQLAATYRRNNAFMHTWKQVSADTKIFCEMRAGTPWAFIFSGSELYMESGFYDLLSAATCNENTYKPAVLHYNSPVQTYISSLDNPLQGKLNLSELTGEQLLDGIQSKSVGGTALVTSANDLCGNTYISETEVFATDSDKIRTQKMAQNRVPSSMYSGKMRLFIQAVYGSKRSDYYINLGINNLPVTGDYTLYMYDNQGDPFELGWDYPYTCGIYTTDNYQFYLMEVVTSEIHFYPLIPSPTGSSLRTKLVESESDLTAQDIEKLEAYILSTCQIDTTNSFTVTISGAPSIGGTPLGYGWKFSKSGHKCTIVIHEDISPTGNLTEFEAHELTVNISNDNDGFYATMLETKSGQWSHNSYCVAWGPDFSNYSQFQFGTFNTGGSFYTNDCPIYGWYDGEDYKSIDLTVDVTYRTDNRTDNFTKYVENGCSEQDLTPAIQCTYNGAVGTISLSDLISESDEILHASSYSLKTWWWLVYSTWSPPATSSLLHYNPVACDLGTSIMQHLVNSGDWEYSGYYIIIWHYPYPGSPYVTGKSFIYNQSSLRYDLYSASDISNTTKYAIIVPLLDAESVTYIKKVSHSVGSEITNTGAIDSSCFNDFWSIQEVDVRLTSGTVTIDGYGATHSAYHIQDFSNSNSGSTDGWHYSIDNATAAMNIVNNAKGASHVIEDGYEVKSTSGSSSSATWADNYVWGDFRYPLGGKTVITKSSYNGSDLTYHGEEDGENRNGYRNDSAIGWA